MFPTPKDAEKGFPLLQCASSPQQHCSTPEGDHIVVGTKPAIFEVIMCSLQMLISFENAHAYKL